MVDTHEADTRGGQGLEARPSALKADRRGRSGIKADNGGHMADKLRGCGLFSSKGEPHSKLFGELLKTPGCTTLEPGEDLDSSGYTGSIWQPRFFLFARALPCCATSKNWSTTRTDILIPMWQWLICTDQTFSWSDSSVSNREFDNARGLLQTSP